MTQMKRVYKYLDESIPIPSTPTVQSKDGSTIPKIP